MRKAWLILATALALIADQATASMATVTFKGADIVALSPSTINASGTPQVGDGRVVYSNGAKYTTYAGPNLDQSAFDAWIASLSAVGNGISWFNLWLQDGASNQAALWGETIALSDPYSVDIHPFASAGWHAEVYTLKVSDWGAAWAGKQIISYWSDDPLAYLSLGTTATFGFTADIMGNDGATGPEYQMWIGGGGDNGNYGFQRAITARVPEPASLALFGVALAGLFFRQRRKNG